MVFSQGTSHPRVAHRRMRRWRWRCGKETPWWRRCCGALLVLFPAQIPGDRRTRWICRRRRAEGRLFFALWCVADGIASAGGAWNGESLRFPQRCTRPGAVGANAALAAGAVAANVTRVSRRWFRRRRCVRSVVWSGWRCRRGRVEGAARPAGDRAGAGLDVVFFLPVSNLWPRASVGTAISIPLRRALPSSGLDLVAPVAPGWRSAGGAGGAIYALQLAVRLGQGLRRKNCGRRPINRIRARAGGDLAGLLREEVGDAAARANSTGRRPRRIRMRGRVDQLGRLEGRAEAWANRNACCGAPWSCTRQRQRQEQSGDLPRGQAERGSGDAAARRRLARFDRAARAVRANTRGPVRAEVIQNAIAAGGLRVGSTAAARIRAGRARPTTGSAGVPSTLRLWATSTRPFSITCCSAAASGGKRRRRVSAGRSAPPSRRAAAGQLDLEPAAR